MRGSGSQFGVVTKYTIKPHHIGQVYGGFCLYDDGQDDKIHAALHEFTANGAQDPKAAVIVSQLVAVGGSKSNIMYTFYDGPTPPTTGPFADFLKIPGIGCNPKTRSYADLVSAHMYLISMTSTNSIKLKTNGEPARLLNSRVSFRVGPLQPFFHTTGISLNNADIHCAIHR